MVQFKPAVVDCMSKSPHDHHALSTKGPGTLLLHFDFVRYKLGLFGTLKINEKLNIRPISGQTHIEVLKVQRTVSELTTE